MVERTALQTETFNYTYEMFLHSIEILTSRLKGKYYNGIYVIPRGGLMIGLFLSHRLRLPIINQITNNTLIIDDICDTGNTLIKYPNNDKAVLVTKVTGAINVNKLNYDITCKDNEWVKFFWEV